jgi:hypothetical protein
MADKAEDKGQFFTTVVRRPVWAAASTDFVSEDPDVFQTIEHSRLLRG